MHSCPGCAHEAASGGVAVCHIASDNYVQYLLSMFSLLYIHFIYCNRLL